MKGKFMKRIVGKVIVSAVILVFLTAGCDVSVNPLVFEGAPVSAHIEIDTEQTSFDHSTSVDLNTALAGIDEVVDSLTLYDITFKVENQQSPSPGTPFNGYLYIDDVKLVDIEGLTLGDFETEQSLFADKLTDYVTVNITTLAMLGDKLSRTPFPTVNIKAAGDADEGPLKFVLRVTLYSQVYTTP